VAVGAFRFDGRRSPLRAWDIRFRVAAVALLSAAILASPPWSLAPLAVIVLGLLALARSTPAEIVRVVRGFAGFLLFFLGLGALFEPTWDHVAFLALQSARLVLLLLLGHGLFLAATPTDVLEGIRWYLGWLGRRRAWAAASMASWALASVPLILDQASSLLDAAALRGLSPARHPLKLVKLLTLALLLRTISRANDLASALEARGFGRTVPPSELKARPRDALALAAVALAAAASWLLVPGGIFAA
jgi:biotin transport system permease protein